MIVVLLLLAATAIAVVLLAPRWRALPVASEWRRLLERDVALYRRLPPALRDELHGHLQVFLAEKRFVGCAGLVVTEAMRVTIAAQACLLLLNRPADYFPGFTSILLYPDAFVVPRTVHDGVLETRDHEARSGEAWQRGPVVLSWADVLRDMDRVRPEHNVVLHEFAHKLDAENDVMDGLPVLDDAGQYRRWSEIMQREYGLLQQAQATDGDDVLDDYGATAPAEFFAVATEAFFERPAALERERPALYAVLKHFYRVDPARW